MITDLDNNLVVLVRPPMCFSRSTYSSPVTPPIALAYLAACLRQKNIPVKCIDAVGEDPSKLRIHESLDCNLRGISLDEVIDAIPMDAKFIGVSCMFSQEWLLTRELLGKIRAARPNAIIIVGGEHVTAMPDHVLDTCAAVDVCAIGEGEGIIVDIVEQYESSPDTILGIVFRKDGENYHTTKRERIRDIGDIPLPAWDLVPIRNYHEFGACNGINNGISMPIVATRGCPFQCTFCSNPIMWGNRYFMRPPESVIDEIESYVDEYGATNIEFYDLTAIIQKKWIMEFASLYKQRKLTVAWTLPSGTRSEALDDDVLKELAETNCKYLVYAAESGSNETLKLIKKKIQLPKMMASMRSAKRNGIALRCNLIIGLPSETRWSIFQTLFFQWRLAILGVDDLPLYMFSPYPGSQLFRELLAKGRLGELDDNYFKSLLQQIDFLRCKSYNDKIAGWELAIYRLIGMSVGYLLTYTFHPQRIVRTFKNIFVRGQSDTVFEQRLIEMRRNKKASRNAESLTHAASN